MGQFKITTKNIDTVETFQAVNIIDVVTRLTKPNIGNDLDTI